MNVPIEVRWRDLSPDYSSTPMADEIVIHRSDSCGREHPLYLFDQEKVDSMLRRFAELGGREFDVSQDLGSMLIGHMPGYEQSARMMGFVLHCRHDLPPNSVMKTGSVPSVGGG